MAEREGRRPTQRSSCGTLMQGTQQVPHACKCAYMKLCCNMHIPTCRDLSPVTALLPLLHAAPARSLAHMWRYGMHQTCADVIQCIVLEGKRPDAAAALVAELTDRQCAADVAAGLLAQLVQTDRTPAAVEVLNGLLAAHQYVAAARACVEMARCARIRCAAH